MFVFDCSFFLIFHEFRLSIARLWVSNRFGRDDTGMRGVSNDRKSRAREFRKSIGRERVAEDEKEERQAAKRDVDPR